jgi:hypothetical protein
LASSNAVAAPITPAPMMIASARLAIARNISVVRPVAEEGRCVAAGPPGPTTS